VLAGADRRWGTAPGFWSTIGGRTLKYAAWGDGYDEYRVVDDGDAWSVWYGKESALCGVLRWETMTRRSAGADSSSNRRPSPMPAEPEHMDVSSADWATSLLVAVRMFPWRHG
jgi:hypothetical protein